MAGFYISTAFTGKLIVNEGDILVRLNHLLQAENACGYCFSAALQD